MLVRRREHGASSASIADAWVGAVLASCRADFHPINGAAPTANCWPSIRASGLGLQRRTSEVSVRNGKDVAAFANHLGGTLLLGAVESDEVLRNTAA